MHSHSLSHWAHEHTFLGARHDERERRTWTVVALTAAMMILEIVGGTVFGSIALIADGWHMGTHVLALAIAGLAYLFARRHVSDPRFSLGTGKFGELAAFGSAVILAMIALGIGYESVLRLLHPVDIHFREAVPIAALGLCVNLASAWLLRESHDTRTAMPGIPVAGTPGTIMRITTMTTTMMITRMIVMCTTMMRTMVMHTVSPGITGIRTTVPLTCMCWPTRSPRCWRLPACRPPGRSA